jgi:hypothetical protein
MSRIAIPAIESGTRATADIYARQKPRRPVADVLDLE